MSIKNELTFAQKAADAVTWFCGTWTIIGLATLFIAGWIYLNIERGHPWDPWPFIMLNGVFTIIEFYQGPIILMSQNRELERDREAVQEILLTLQTALWQTPQGICTYCKDNHYNRRILPFSIKDYQDSVEYGFCSWECLIKYITEISEINKEQ
jgi:hypothetical protein